MFKRLRIAVLLYVLLFVAAAQFFAARRSTDWDARSGSTSIPSPAMGARALSGMSTISTRRSSPASSSFSRREAKRYGVALEHAVSAWTVGAAIPAAAAAARQRVARRSRRSWWSLAMRWLAAQLDWQSSRPSGDIMVFAVFHEPAEAAALDRSTALQKGLIAVTNLFADRSRARLEPDRARARAAAHARRHGQVLADPERAALPRRLCGTRARAVVAADRKPSSWPAAFRSTSTARTFRRACAQVVIGPATATRDRLAARLTTARHHSALSYDAARRWRFREARYGQSTQQDLHAHRRRRHDGSRQRRARRQVPTCASKRSAHVDETNSTLGLLLAEPGLPPAVARAAAPHSARAVRDRRRAIAAGIRENRAPSTCSALEHDLDALNDDAAAARGVRAAGRQRAPAASAISRVRCVAAPNGSAWAAAKQHAVEPRATALPEPAFGSAVRDGALRSRGTNGGEEVLWRRDP